MNFQPTSTILCQTIRKAMEAPHARGGKPFHISPYNIHDISTFLIGLLNVKSLSPDDAACVEQLQALRVGQERAEAYLEAGSSLKRVRRRRARRHHRRRARHAVPDGHARRVPRGTRLGCRAPAHRGSGE